MNQYKFEDLTIEVSGDPTYDFGSADNLNKYLKHYFGNGSHDYPTSKHGIKIFRDDVEIDSCIVIGSGGATGIKKNSSILDNRQLLICCCDTVFCLELPTLKLRWLTRADQATCFEIFSLQGEYIVHGEIEISRIDQNGNIKWKFGGADIFVSIDNEESFIINSDHIRLMDFCKTAYKIDFDGNIV